MCLWPLQLVFGAKLNHYGQLLFVQWFSLAAFRALASCAVMHDRYNKVQKSQKGYCLIVSHTQQDIVNASESGQLMTTVRISIIVWSKQPQYLIPEIVREKTELSDGQMHLNFSCYSLRKSFSCSTLIDTGSILRIEASSGDINQAQAWFRHLRFCVEPGKNRCIVELHIDH